jgi:hypothetical protein
MMEGIEETEITKKLFEKYRFSSVVLLNENSFNELIIINLAKKHKIPILLLQHGLYYDTAEAYDINKLLGIFPIHSSNLLAWGNVFERYSRECGISPQKIKIIGNPSYDDLFQHQFLSSKHNRYVLLTMTAPEQIWITDLTVKTRKKYEDAIMMIYEITSKLNRKLVIKLHPSQNDIGIKNFEKIYSDVEVIKGDNILPLIESCDLLISFDLSTTILLAQILKKPTVSVTISYPTFGPSQIFKSKSSIMLNLDDLETTLNRILTDETYKQQIVENGTKFVNDYLINQGTSSKDLLSLLKEFNS